MYQMILKHNIWNDILGKLMDFWRCLSLVAGSSNGNIYAEKYEPQAGF